MTIIRKLVFLLASTVSLHETKLAWKKKRITYWNRIM